MAQVTVSTLDNFIQSRDRITDRVKRELKRALAQVDYTDIAKARDEVIKLLVAYCRLSVKAASREAAVLYDQIREASIGSKIGARVLNTVQPQAIDAFVRADIEHVVQTGDTARFINDVVQRVAYETNRASGETMVYNATHDKARTAWARVPTGGSETCEWCIMLASRGAVYQSWETAGGRGHYHQNCKCAVVPVFGARLQRTNAGGWVVHDSDTTIEGYDPAKYYEQYQEFIENGTLNKDKLAEAAAKARRRRG